MQLTNKIAINNLPDNLEAPYPQRLYNDIRLKSTSPRTGPGINKPCPYFVKYIVLDKNGIIKPFLLSNVGTYQYRDETDIVWRYKEFYGQYGSTIHIGFHEFYPGSDEYKANRKLFDAYIPSHGDFSGSVRLLDLSLVNK